MQGEMAINSIEGAVGANDSRERPISIRCNCVDPSTGVNHMQDEQKFANSEEAISYIRQLEEIDRSQEQQINLTSDGSDNVSLGFLFLTAKVLAVPQLAAFCRLHVESSKPWLERNSYKAFRYAQVVVGCVSAVTEEQKQNHNIVTDSFISWPSFYEPSLRNNRSPYYYVDFISKGCPLDRNSNKPEKLEIKNTHIQCDMENSASDVYDILVPTKLNEHILKNDFWSVYERNGLDIVVAFRGGSGGTDDGINHYGSPARGFIKQDETIPRDIRNLAEFLKQRISAQNVHISLVGYSQGGIPAVVTYLLLKEMIHDIKGAQERVQCITYNPATVFWPRYLYDPATRRGLLPQTCQSLETKNYSIKNYLIKNDPLSESIPGKSIPRYTAPRFPGETFILPQRSSNILDNHKLIWFTRWQS